MKKLNDLLYNPTDKTVYIAEYSHYRQGKRVTTCKTCTLQEFLIELTEHNEFDIASIIKNVKFRRF